MSPEINRPTNYSRLSLQVLALVEEIKKKTSLVENWSEYSVRRTQWKKLKDRNIFDSFLLRLQVVYKASEGMIAR